MANANIKAVITAEDRASKVIAGVGNSVNGIAHKIAGAAKVATAAMIAATSAGTVFGLKAAADLETVRQGFKTLLGSAEDADAIMRRIKQEAKRTPFEIAGLSQATQMLTAVTKDGDRALEFVLNIGEGLAAMGRGQAELDRIAVNIQQIAATGRAFGIDIRQFAFAGIPIYEMLQEEIGLTGEALQAFIEEGGVTFDLLEKLFKGATDEGGRWAGAFESQAGTFNQLVSNMKDSFSIFAADMVQKVGAFDLVKRAMQGITLTLSGGNTSLNASLATARERITFLAQIVGGVLAPKFQQLWSIIQTQLIPVLQRLWHEVLEPLMPVIGIIFVTALNIAAIALGKIISLLSSVINWTLNVGRTFTNQSRAMGRFFYDLYSTISNLWNNTKNAWNSFKSKVFEWASGLVSGVVQRIKELPGKITGGITGGVKSIGGSIGNLFKKIPGFAAGGNYSANQPMVVGERGPEMLIPKHSGTVIPNNKMSTGGNQTINISLNVGYYAGTEIEKRKIAQDLFRALQDTQTGKTMLAGVR